MEPAECVSAYVEVDLVDLVDDLQVSGQERLQQVHGPALQSFRQDRVVGVGKGAPGEVPGLQERGALERNTVHCPSLPAWLMLHNPQRAVSQAVL